MTRLVFREVSLPEGIRDVAVDDGIISAVGESLRSRDAAVIDGAGGALIPGLHDHHLHLHALAAASASVRCGPPHVTSPDELAAALDTAPTRDSGWIRGIGYVETVAGLLDSVALDRLHGRRPVRLQHRSGAVWFLNSAAVDAAGLASGDHPGIERDAAGKPTGRVWRADTWLRSRVGDGHPPDLRPVGETLARFGITGVTDATPDLPGDTLDHLVAAHRNGDVPQRLHLLGVGPDTVTDLPPTVTVGPYKIVLADSGLPDFPWLCDRIRAVHDRGRGVAVHCVTRESLLLLLAAIDEVGAHPDDRVEHGAIIAPETVNELSRRRLPVITQPGFLTDRGDDFLDRLSASDVPDLYRCGSLVRQRVPLTLSSDAPYGPLDPWTVIAAAATRMTPGGRVAGRAERIDRATALERCLAPLDAPGSAPRTVTPGRPADVVLLDRPLQKALDTGSESVRCTMIGGRITYRR
ncbi:amidohydrolase family protein [Gordonia jinghuaiqii]|uniref:Amidohydrolase family protein n=1 Tax=Gordonia jinghuaiqii TaxID=2758710 RepID=A0A7D7QH11_9ACTN|nr:amidohydrolase family protein [Gordonia jinghuaiqii]MCR5977605.1 amidohydrolase family protein [Gordonia jinghuaiqii]QMT02282.1 amidohydrolase family protein [Gordonia jinghuaiqii]